MFVFHYNGGIDLQGHNTVNLEIISFHTRLTFILNVNSIKQFEIVHNIITRSRSIFTYRYLICLTTVQVIVVLPKVKYLNLAS